MLTETAVDAAVGFRSLDRETETTALPVRGDLPPWLTGSLVRTGPARFEVGERSMRHWFDGLAMLHRFGFAEGGVSYTGRFLRSQAFEHAERTGEIGFSEFATDPCRSIFQRVASAFSPKVTDNANVNVVRLGGETLALTETPLPVAFEPGTLQTLGVTDWAKRIPGQITIAHPHADGGALVSYAAHLGPRNRYRIYELRPGGGEVRVVADVPVDQPAYMHSFALTPRFAVLTEWPLVVNPLRLLASGRPFIENYRWEPERGTRYTVVDRADGSVRARVEGPAAFAFHHVNAFEDGDDIVLDLCAYEDASIIDVLYLDAARSGAALPPVRPERHRVPLSGGDVRVERLAEVNFELPRINYGEHNGRPYRYAYGSSSRAGFLDTLVKLDVERGETELWWEDGCFAGEPVFVRDPDGGAEDAGVLLSVVLDARRESSFLLVLDAATMSERARAEVPHAIPFHFHGNFLKDRS